MPPPAERIKPSATVILTRRHPTLEVFLVERSRRTRFFPGYHAFPGGVVDAEDGEGPDGRRRAALRELFEETGVLATLPQAPKETDRSRRGDARGVLLAHGLTWDASRLVEAGTLVTPAFGPVRYDTTFYLLELPFGEEPRVMGDELAGGRWWRPAEALRRWEEDAFPIPPPTLAYLHLLAGQDDPKRVAALARSTDGKPHHERFRIELHPGVFVLPLRTRTLPPATTTNCYLFDGDPILVVDPGASEDADLVPLQHTLDAMTRDGRGVVVVLTHHHGDHVGGAAAVKRRYNARVLAHARTATALPHGLVDDVLDGGESIDLGVWGARPWRVEALHTPGHAPGHLALRDARWGAILAGDLVSGVSTIVIDPAEGDMGEYLASLQRCADLKPHAVMPGHGPILPAGAFADTLAHRRTREGKILAALSAQPQGVDALVAKAYDDTPKEAWPLAERSLVSQLVLLERQGKAARDASGWRRV